TYQATDGSLTGARSARIRVESEAPPAGPATPRVVSPLSGAEVASLRPVLRVQTGEHSRDPTVDVEFQLYADAGMSELVEEGVVVRNPAPGEATQWQPSADLDDNTRYYWRARARSPEANSEWVTAQLFVNLFNDAPGSFNLASPAPGAVVATQTPLLSATNAVDVDGDLVTYGFEIYADATLTEVVASAVALPPGHDGHVRWQVTTPLEDRTTYYWRGIATDEHGARTLTPVRSFRVSLGNQAPTVPAIASPVPGTRITDGAAVWLRVSNATDPDGDALTYLFEVDVVATFDSSERRASGEVPTGSGGTTGWQVTGLADNVHYYWRVRASDGASQSDWVVGDFIMDARNESPSVPVVANPGDRAWVSSRTPTFTVHPSTDPDGDSIVYAFEVYADVGLGRLVASGTSTTGSWQPSSPLEDRTTHYWRVRAQDVRGAASAWSPVMTLFGSTGNYVPPTIAVTSPATVVNAASGTVAIEWTGTNPNIEPRVALYYGTVGSGYAGTKIVDGLAPEPGTGQGRYQWSTAGLAPGAYYVYGVIYDDRGTSRAYAPGAVVVPAKPQL